jgi:O-antigen ligase
MERRLQATAEGLLLVALAAAPWAYGGAPDAARFLIAAVLLGGGSAWCVARALGRAGLPALAVPATALPLLAVVQAVTGLSAAPVWTIEAALVGAAMMSVVVFWSDRARDRAAALRAATVVLAACAAQALFGAVQWSRTPSRVYGEASPIVTTPFGSYVNHNHFAGFVGLGVVLSAAMTLGHARRRGTPTAGAVALAGLSLGLSAAHLASRSRGGLLALAAALAVLAIVWAGVASRQTSGRRHLAFAAAAGVLVVAFGVSAVPVATRTHLVSLLRGPADASGEYRTDVARATVRLALAHPLLGSGLGAYADAFPAFKRGHGQVRTTHAESDVLEFAAEVGLAGLLILAWLAAVLWRGFRNRMEQGRDPFRRAISVGALAACAGVAAHSLVDFNLRLPANALAFATLLGLAAAPKDDPPTVGGRALPWAVAVFLGVLSVGAVWRAAAARAYDAAVATTSTDRRLAALDRVVSLYPYVAEAYRVRGLAWRDRGVTTAASVARLEWARHDLERATRLRPHWGEAWADLGWTRFLQGGVHDARLALTRGVELDPTHITLGLARAELLARIDGPVAAVEEVRRLQRANPDWEVAKAQAAARRWTRDPAHLEALDGRARLETLH